MAFLLLVPFFLIRFGLLAFLSRDAVSRAAHFAPMVGRARTAGVVYQISNIGIFLSLFFLKIKTAPPGLFHTGVACYIGGLVLLVASVIGYATPSGSGINQTGIYRLSRNPMYVAYFFVFLSWALLTQSPVFLCLVLVYQLSTHWIILAEEQWCVQQFGPAYLDYMKKVRRYL